MHAAFAKSDMRRGNMRHHSFPRKIASDFAATAFSLSRLDLPTRAPKPLLVFGSPVRPTKLDLRQSWLSRPHQASHWLD
jgi:hypothetical protein